MTGTPGPRAKERALDEGRRAFGIDWSPTVWSRAPGRLELLGNHIDYNGGPVLAAAIDRDVVCLLREGCKPGVSMLFSDISPNIEVLEPTSLVDWTNPAPSLNSFDYVRGVISTGLNRGVRIRDSVEISVCGDVPIGFGLSSSAALCVALTLVLHVPAPGGRELVLRAQEAEHRAGTPCGTMDQSASVGGNVILFDGASVTWQSIVPNLGDYVFAVADSGVARSLATSSYGHRVKESQQGLVAANDILATSYNDLSNISECELTQLLSSNNSEFGETLKRRVRHVVTETARVRLGIQAMHDGDWRQFGMLMNQSGDSSAQDYEISHPAVEEIVGIARTVPGVAGARMMGGGEGGTALILLRNDSEGALQSQLNTNYYTERCMNSGEAVRGFQFSPGASVGNLV